MVLGMGKQKGPSHKGLGGGGGGLGKRFYFKCALKWFSKSFNMGDNGGTQLILVKDELDRCMDNGEKATWC